MIHLSLLPDPFPAKIDGSMSVYVTCLPYDASRWQISTFIRPSRSLPSTKSSPITSSHRLLQPSRFFWLSSSSYSDYHSQMYQIKQKTEASNCGKRDVHWWTENKWGNHDATISLDSEWIDCSESCSDISSYTFTMIQFTTKMASVPAICIFKWEWHRGVS